MLKKFLISLISTLIITAAIPLATYACTTVLVGKDATVDGSTIIARNEDAKTAWTKRFVVVPSETFKDGDMYVSKGNGFTYPMPKETLKYTATPDWDQSAGNYYEDGINTNGVCVSATESATANDKALKADPLVENGIGEDSIATILLGRAKTAKEGAELLGKIIETKGASEVNGTIISDKNEIWYVENGSGHHWVARRVPDDCYAVIPNKLVIGNVDLNDTENFLGSKDLIEFAKDNGLYNDKTDGGFSFKLAYGTDNEEDAKYNYPRMWDGQRILTPSKEQKITSHDFETFLKPDQKVSVDDVKTVLRSHFDGTPYDSFGEYKDQYRPISVPQTMESHILQCKQNLPKEVGCIQYLALGVSDRSTYVPFYSGITETPKDYQKGTDKPDNESAYWTYRKSAAMTKPYYDKFQGMYTKPLSTALEAKLDEELDKNTEHFKDLVKKDPKKASEEMNKYTEKMANYAQEKTKELNDKLIVATTAQTPVKHNSKL